MEDLKPGIIVKGSRWPEPINIKKTELYDPYVKIVASGTESNENFDQMIPLSELADMDIQVVNTDFSAKPREIFLALESKRYHFASTYDPLLAMSTSKVDPLPHQIDAVYGHVLRMPKIRFLLAHDPGAGKTIMAGLIIKELKIRKIVNRILIVVPGHLKDQWSREMKDRFSETFTIMSKDYMRSQYGENAWDKENQIITSIDFAKRDENIPSLKVSEFDLIVVDEAHKMSAYMYGKKKDKTSRYRLGEILSKNSEHLLFLTATPHKGDPENFRLFLDLLSPGFFKTTDMIKESLNSNHHPLFLRKMKEHMVDFNGKPLFVPREVKTPEIRLSDLEKTLYNEVSHYVKMQYNKALNTNKKRNIGFALVILQRRMASSTYALLQSLQRRKTKLEKMLDGSLKDNQDTPSKPYDIDEIDDMSEEERWREEELWETLSVAENRQELEREISTLSDLIHKARNIIEHETEKKLIELKDTLANMGKSDSKEKILIFTESKDTLKYIDNKIRGWGYSTNTIHGNMSLEGRVNAESVFKNSTQIMVATEAAGEGINLQFCHFMINYDLPWNPNRLEQRMGRIHRYGQQKNVTVFNLVASDTREGEIMKKLFEKLEEIKLVMNSDKVFDVISEIIPGKRLSDLLHEAATTTRNQHEILKDLDIKVDTKYIEGIRDKLGDSLATKYIDYTSIHDMKNRAEENKLIPKYTEEFFKKAFTYAGGRYHIRKDGFMSIDSIPNPLRKVAVDDSFKKKFGTIRNSYPKATFDKQTAFKNPDVEFVTFGNPLFESILQWIDKNFSHEMQNGAVFLDPMGRDGHILFYEGEIRDGTNHIAGKKLLAYFVSVSDGAVTPIDPAIMCDLKEEGNGDPGMQEYVDRIKGDLIPHVMSSLEEYRDKLQKKRNHQAAIKRKYGIESLSQSIRDVDNAIGDLRIRKDSGENVDIAIRNKKDKLESYMENKDNLEKNIREEKTLTMSSPSFFGIICVKPMNAVEPDMRSNPEVENLGMKVVMAYEKEMRRKPEDVSRENLGFDVRSTDAHGTIRHIEVKARAGEGRIAMSTNEYYQA